MPAIYCDEGLTSIAQTFHGDGTNGRPSAGGAMTMRLFVNDLTPLTESSVYADFTSMSTLGYVAVNFSGPTWKYNLDTTNHTITGAYSLGWLFTTGTPVTIYGWFATIQDPSSVHRVVMAEKFANSVIVGATRLTLAITLNVQMKLCS